jgi:hypothetical protein
MPDSLQPASGLGTAIRAGRSVGGRGLLELVKATVRGIRRILGTAKIKKAPATAERLLAMAANTGAGLKGLRDRALLLIGFAGAWPRTLAPASRASVTAHCY